MHLAAHPLLLRLLLTVLFSLFLCSKSSALALPPINVAWNANSEPDIARYILRFGTSSGVYNRFVLAGVRPQVQVSGLEEGVTYYFAVFAVSKAGLLSPPSAEITYRVDPPVRTPPTGTITSPAQDLTILAGQNVAFSASAADPQALPLSYAWNFGTNSGLAGNNTLAPGTVNFNVPGIYTVSFTATNSAGLVDPKPPTRKITVLANPTRSLLSRAGWTLQYVDSQEIVGYAASNAFDGNASTFWHTQFVSKTKKPPHEIQINLGATRPISGFNYLPRQDSNLIGNIGKFEFYVSMDGKKWGKPVAKGTFSADSKEKRVFFKPIRAKFIRLRSLSEANGNLDSSLAELSVWTSSPPVSLPQSVTTTTGNAAKFTLRGVSAANAALKYTITGKPKNGTLTGTAPNLTYTPKKGFTGSDSLTFTVTDGASTSQTSTVTFAVKAKTASRSAASAMPPVLAKISPASPPAKTATTSISGKKFLTLTIKKSPLTDGTRRVIEVSPDLLNWSSGPRHTTVLRDDASTLKVRDNTPLAPGKKRHIRLRPTPR